VKLHFLEFSKPTMVFSPRFKGNH